jgi:gamma-glutamylcyclotransferase (GGCT)/AIG2-like uncharacterized protein YtfP
VNPGPSKQLLFVYGSLKRGFSNHRQLSRAAFVGECQTAQRYRLFLLGPYPALASEGEHRIHGELYAVDRRTLAKLDVFEGKAYRRAGVELADGRNAHAYFLVSELSGRAVPGLHSRWP